MNQPFSMGFLGADSKTAKTDSIWARMDSILRGTDSIWRFMASK